MFEQNDFGFAERTKYAELPPAYVRLKNFKRKEFPDLKRCETEIKLRDAKNLKIKYEN